MEVLGVDGWKGKWVAVTLQNGKWKKVEVFPSLMELRAASDAQIIAVDVPIGLVERPPRIADMEARSLLGPRRSSVFDAPPAFCLDEKWDNYRDANAESKRVTGRGISAQSFALIKNIREAHIVAEADPRIYEVHPELCFLEIAGQPLDFIKKSWNGQLLRRRLLSGEGIEIPDQLPDECAGVPADDLLDAAAAAWSAHRIATNQANAIPDAGKRRERIWS